MSTVGRHIIVKVFDHRIGLHRDSRYFIGIRDDSEFLLQHLHGPAAPVTALRKMMDEWTGLDICIPEDAYKQHAARKHPWRVHTRVGLSGCRDYSVMWIRDEEIGDFPRGRSFHVSMTGMLNERVCIPLIDIIPILDRIYEDFEQDDTFEVRWECPHRRSDLQIHDGWHDPA